jgi:predicted site-specific integrase-resolvase
MAEIGLFVGLISVVAIGAISGTGDKLSSAFGTMGGHRRYDRAALLERTESESPRVTIAYAKVSCHDQKDDLVRQAERLKNVCVQRGWTDAEVIADLGSGLNFAKRGLIRLVKLICSRRIERLVVGP